jgi:ABC-type nitrate/sulfonate/bicarbonate transport system permease component
MSGASLQLTPPRAVPRRPGTRRGRASLGIWLLRIGFLAALLLAWEVATASASRALIVPPSEVARAVYHLTFVDPVLPMATFLTARAFIIGFSGSIVVGILIGLAMGRSRTLERVLDPWVFFLYAIPSIALIPVMVIWFGIGDLVKIMLVFIASVFPIIINTAAGVRNVDEEVIDTARAYCATERQILRTVVLPGSVPFIFAGVRVGLSQALVGVIGAEILSIISGLGGLIITYANDFKTDEMFAPIVVIIVLALLMTEIMRRVQARVSRWRVAEAQ